MAADLPLATPTAASASATAAGARATVGASACAARPPCCARLRTGEQRQRVASYSEGLLVGYRWYNAHNATPAFPFGHGLSYTTFALAGLRASPTRVTVTVTNTGRRPGAAAPQLYLTFPPSAGEPPGQLRGFAQAQLQPGESAEVRFPLRARDMSVWNATTHAWQLVHGSFGVAVGLSSRDAAALRGAFRSP